MEYFIPLMLVGAVVAAALFGITNWLRN
ncbi:hypothetical protein CVH13_01442, partial [Dehalococcoides mccartyi]